MKTFGDSYPLWMNGDFKNKVKLKHKSYHCYIRHQRNNKNFAKPEGLLHQIGNLISESKKEYYRNINKKLNDLLKSSKTYWSIMKTVFNGKKVAAIHPLLFNSAFTTGFQEKTNIFNSCFSIAIH